MKLIIGYNGLVGTTLCESEKYDHYFNSSNMHNFSSVCVDGAEVVLACLPATKWKVNQNIKKDLENINKIIYTLSKYEYSKITLISTIDVYANSPLGSNEDSTIGVTGLHYGSNRYLFELLVREYLKTRELNIFRLPALFNKNIKKNVLFDLMYKNNLQHINTNSSYQWYNLNNLSNDINKYTLLYPNNNIYNLFTEPIETVELIKLFPSLGDEVGHHSDRVEYRYTTTLSKNGFIQTKEEVLKDIKTLIYESSSKCTSLGS